MREHFLRLIALRLLASVLVLFIVLTLVFFMSRAIGDPAKLLAGTDLQATREGIEEIRERLGLNDPLHERYGRFVWNAVQLDFGVSHRSAQPAMEDVASRMWNTIQLALAALIFAIGVGVPIGVLAAIKRGSAIDLFGRFVALIGQATPSFWQGLMLIFLFSVALNLLPTGGKGDFRHLIMPAVTLGSFFAAGMVRLTRSAMLEVLDSDYIRTARSKGLRELTVIRRHALRNALFPVITILGLYVGDMIAGSIIIETVFAWPGVGLLIWSSIRGADFPVVQASVVVTASWVIIANLMVDLSYTYLDPRVREATV
jgi:ABC-type dipeptide/oligopeptide/nickel transport system permease component